MVKTLKGESTGLWRDQPKNFWGGQNIWF